MIKSFLGMLVFNIPRNDLITTAPGTEINIWEQYFPLWKKIGQLHKKMKKCSEETQTPHTGCSKVEPKICAPSQTPFPGAQEGQNLISWRWSLPLRINPVSWGSMHTTLSYRGNRPTHPHRQTHPPTHKQTGPITIHCAAASTQCKEKASVEQQS